MATVNVDYDRHGSFYTYAQSRRADPRIAAAICDALGDAKTVLNVGGGAGSYEPEDRWVLAVEPSATMRAQRPSTAAPAINCRAESLPFDDRAVDAAMACMTIHHWQPPEQGLAEMRRVARSAVVVFTCEQKLFPEWQWDYFEEPLGLEQERFPTLDLIASGLGGKSRVERISTPCDCADGFVSAFWNRPEVLLDPAVRAGQSMWARLEDGVEDQLVRRLEADLRSGEWDRRYGSLRGESTLACGLCLVISDSD